MISFNGLGTVREKITLLEKGKDVWMFACVATHRFGGRN
jgi:hypothetical protein